jgi:hypothetical protein
MNSIITVIRRGGKDVKINLMSRHNSNQLMSKLINRVGKTRITIKVVKKRMT